MKVQVRTRSAPWWEFSCALFWPSKPCQYNGKVLQCPAESEVLLERFYGADWQTPNKETECKVTDADSDSAESDSASNSDSDTHLRSGRSPKFYAMESFHRSCVYLDGTQGRVVHCGRNVARIRRDCSLGDSDIDFFDAQLVEGERG